MKQYPSKRTKFTPSKTQPHEGKSIDQDIDSVAEELVQLANTRLPDGVMKGVLNGCEDDIRQEAILQAMKWYIRQRSGDPAPGTDGWNTAQAICAALRYAKLNAIKQHAKDQKVRHAVSIQSLHAQRESLAEEWSPAEIRKIVKHSIQQALKQGLISTLNASIALQVYVDGVSVKDLAACLNRTTGAIHQHLARVREVIPEIIHSLRD